MKKIYILLMVIPLLLTSCKKDKDGPENEVFSQKTVEQNKAIVETAGLDMMKTMDEMADLDAIELCVNLGETLDRADPFESSELKKSKLNSTVHAIADLGNKRDLNSLFNNLKGPGELAEDPETIQEVWDEVIGTYTWNAEMEKWDYEANANEIIFLFPAMENSTSNDGKVRIYGYQGVTIANPIDEEYEGDIPTAIAFEISYNNTVLIDFAFTAQYDDEGIPTMIAADLNIPPFKWELDFTSSDSQISSSYKFTHNQQIVMELTAGAKGLFTDENIENNTITETHTETYIDYRYNYETNTWEEVEVTDTWESEEFMFEEVVNSADAKFQLFNLLIKGQVNIKGLVDELRIVDQDRENTDWEERTDEQRLEWDTKEAEAINEYMSLRVLNAELNEIIAEIEAYVVSETDDWGYFDSWIDFRFKFGDGSTIDAETYFDDGFENFVDEINDFIQDLNSDYDLDIETIDY